MSVLEKIRSLSQMASSDANLVIESALPEEDEVSLQDLYVTRISEKEILNIITTSSEPQFILVIGEAGYGKTSLLWNLHQTISCKENNESWFIKSSLLRQKEATSLNNLNNYNIGLSKNEILEAISQIKKLGCSPLLIFDTVDLLLHNEEDRFLILDLVRSVISNQSSLIASCRPQEAALLRPLKPIRIFLRQYDDEILLSSNKTELSQAVENHVAKFCAHFDETERVNQLQTINQAVASGNPIRNVCINPLSLRMLFDIYRPALITSEINIFQLYNDYWAKRVITDYRSGMPESLTPKVDLSSAATLSALTMLAEGTPEITVEVLEKGIDQINLVQTVDWISLIGRNVLQKSELGTVNFFHQTFFEHCAARGLLKYFGENSLVILEHRLKLYPHDLFLIPIYEQVLLLAGLETSQIRQQADLKLIELLKSRALASKLAGIYVYCHHSQVSRALTQIVIENLQSGDPVFVDRYLEVIPNVPTKRLKETFFEFDIIWNREITGIDGEEKWREQDHLLDVLPNFTVRSPHLVKEFLVRNKVFDEVLCKPPTFSGYRKLLKLYKLLAVFEPDWTLEALAELFSKTLSLVKNRDLQVAIFQEIYRSRDIFGIDNIASRFSQLLEGFDNTTQATKFDAMATSYGQLWAIEWRYKERNLSNIIQDIEKLPDGIGLRSKVKALVFLLVEATPAQLDEVWHYYINIKDSFRQWLWKNQVWADLLEETIKVEKSQNTESNEKSSLPSYHWFIKKIKVELKIPLHNSGKEFTAESLFELIYKAQIPIQMVGELLDQDWLRDPEVWLTNEKLKGLLHKALLANHEGAIGAIKIISEYSNKYRSTIQKVNASLTNEIAVYPQMIGLLLELCLKIEDGTSLNRIINKVPENELLPALFYHREELDQLQQKMLNSKEPSTRNNGVRLCNSLIKINIVSPPDYEILKQKIFEEPIDEIKGQLILLMGTTAPKFYSLEDAFVFLVPWSKSKNENLRRIGLQSLLSVAVEITNGISQIAELILGAVLAPPTDAGRIILLRPFIEKLIPINIELAFDLIIKVALHSGEAGLGINARRRVFSHYQKVVRLLIRVAYLSQIEEILELVPHLDRHFGALFIESICIEKFQIVKDKLEKLLDDSRVPRDVQKIIVRFKNSDERISGNVGWSELYSLIRQEAVPNQLISRETYMNENTKKDIMIGIIFALKEEFKEFIQYLPSFTTIKDEKTKRRFYEFSFPFNLSSPFKEHNCVAMFINSMGSVQAAIATENLLRRYNIKTIVVIGLAGALSKDLNIGDIVIPDVVEGYLENSKAIPSKNDNEFEFHLSGDPYRTTPDNLRDIDNLEFESSDDFQKWENSCSHRFEGILTNEDYQKNIEKLIRKGLLNRKVNLLTNVPIASGPTVSGSIAFVKWLLQHNRKYAAVEMETQGVMASIFDKVENQSILVLRCISDYGDERKKELDKIDKGALRRYALHNAVELLWTLLKNKN